MAARALAPPGSRLQTGGHGPRFFVSSAATLRAFALWRDTLDATTDVAGVASPLAAEAPLAVSERPYAPSWVNRLIWAVDGLPGPAWAWYVGAAVIGIVLSSLQPWLSDEVPFGQFTIAYSFYGVLLVALVAVMAWLDGVARASLQAFRPAIAIDDVQVAALTYELTVIPARPAWVVTVGLFLVTPLYYLADPVGTHTAQLSGPSLFLRYLAEGLISTLFVLLAYHTLRQLRAVDRLNGLVRNVDLFRPAPLYAFSRLTYRTAMAILVLLFSSLLADPTTWEDLSPVLLAPWVVGIVSVALSAFVLPLRGMHGLLVREKLRLQGECGRRLTEVTTGDPRCGRLGRPLAGGWAEQAARQPCHRAGPRAPALDLAVAARSGHRHRLRGRAAHPAVPGDAHAGQGRLTVLTPLTRHAAADPARGRDPVRVRRREPGRTRRAPPMVAARESAGRTSRPGPSGTWLR